jgi:PPOX class probable F420-dependent enzyme
MKGLLDRRLLTAARFGCLATHGADGAPHLVPIVFAVRRDTVYTPVDAKPKRSRRLERIRNLERNPEASVLIFNWNEDWSQLWWIRLRGTYRAVTEPVELESARQLLINKYPAYRDPSELDPLIAIDVTAVKSWSASRCSQDLDPDRHS